MDENKNSFEFRPDYMKALKRSIYLRKKLNGLNSTIDNITDELEITSLKAKIALCESQLLIAENDLAKAREKYGIIPRK